MNFAHSKFSDSKHSGIQNSIMTAIIVDDEARGRRILKSFCEEYCPQLKILDMAASVEEARALLTTHSPDIVFLDIEMPHENGFVLLEEYASKMPFEVIFTTAYEQYGLQAFDVDAMDYLLKPIQIDELIAAVEQVAARLNLQKNPSKLGFIKELVENGTLDKIALTTLDGYTFTNPNQIVRCEAQGNYTSVYFENGTSLLLTRTLKHYDDLLQNRGGFFRIHKSHLINLKYVRQFIKGRQAFVEMNDNTQLEVSERKRKNLLHSLGTGN